MGGPIFPDPGPCRLHWRTRLPSWDGAYAVAFVNATIAVATLVTILELAPPVSPPFVGPDPMEDRWGRVLLELPAPVGHLAEHPVVEVAHVFNGSMNACPGPTDHRPGPSHAVARLLFQPALPALRACYRRSGAASGAFVVLVSVDEWGQSRNVEVIKDAVGVAAVTECVLKVVKGVAYPNPAGKPTSVVLPFHVGPGI